MIEIGNYVRNIAVFMIFSSFIGIIMPGEKYKQYVDLVLGIVLIFVIIAPLGGIIAGLSGGSGDIFSDINLSYDRAVMARHIESAEEAGLEQILSNYREALTEQLRRIVGNHAFTLHHAEFEIDTGEDFGKILHLHLVVSQGEASSARLVRIDPVRINPAINTRGQAQTAENGDVETPQIMSLKNVISDFYNLDMSNIILEMRDDL